AYDQRLVHQTNQEVRDVGPLDPPTKAHLLGGLQGPPATEHGESSQDGPFFFGQQVVRPVDERLQRLLPGQGRAAAPGEEAEPVVETIEDLVYRQRAEAGGCQLDG